MKPIEPFELSGYLDGELEPDRVRELEAVLERDPALRAEYEALANADRDWKSAAGLAAFAPNTQLQISKSFTHSPLALATVLVLLVVLRMTPKLTDVFAWGLVLHAIVLAIALQWVVRMARED